MEHKHCCVIDVSNFYKTLVLVISRTKQGEDGSVTAEAEVQYYAMLPGETLIEAAPPSMRKHAGTAGFIKPKWDAESNGWIEGATAEQITAWEQENPDPVSVEEKRATKIVELSAACEAAINAGTTVPMPDQTQEVFTYSTADQANVSEMFMACLMGADGYLYHENGGECRLYSKAEIVAIYGTLSMYKTGQLTYHNQIK